MSYRIDRVLSFLVVLLVSIAPLHPAVVVAQTPSGAETTLIDAEVQRFNAQMSRDLPALKQALADELVYTHATGRVQNKAEYLSGFEAGSMRYSAIEVPDRVAQVYGNTGVTHGTITITVGAANMKLTSRYTGVYINRDGRWQLLSWQATDIRAPESK